MSAIITTTTVTTVVSSTLAASLSLVVVLLLLVLLVLKEIVSSFDAAWAQRCSQTLNVALVPLLISSGIVVTLRVVEALG